MSGGRAFIDTNVVVYLFDDRSPRKQRSAGALVQKLAEEQTVRVISTQVLQEAYSVLTSKLHVNGTYALTLLQKMERSGIRVETTDVPLIWRAATRSIDNRLSFWDALILESAIRAQCTRLYTEDLQHGWVFGSVTVVNPFT
jgi:predicted nucleic acid-binding protein